MFEVCLQADAAKGFEHILAIILLASESGIEGRKEKKIHKVDIEVLENKN